MWDSNFDVSTTGGFVNDNQRGSATKKKEQTRRVQNIVPVFISYINDCPDEDFTLHGVAVQMVDVVGVIRTFDVQSTKATCVIEDQSGSIEAILWLETDRSTVSPLPPVKENCYARVFGSVRTQDGSKMIMILKIVPVEDVNVLTHHRLQIIHSKLSLMKMAKGVTTKDQVVPGTFDSMSFGDVSLNSNPHGLTTLQAKILDVMKVNGQEGVGVSKDTILKHFPGQAELVRKALDFFLAEGHAFTTCDNDHYQVTDSS